MVDSLQEDRSQRSAPQRRRSAHLRRHAHCTPGKPSGRDRGGDKMHLSTWRERTHQTPGRLSSSDMGREQNAGPTESVPLWSTQEPEPERHRPGKCTQCRACFRQLLQSNLEPEQCRPGKHTHREQGQIQCGPDTVSTPHTRQ